MLGSTGTRHTVALLGGVDDLSTGPAQETLLAAPIWLHADPPVTVVNLITSASLYLLAKWSPFMFRMSHPPSHRPGRAPAPSAWTCLGARCAAATCTTTGRVSYCGTSRPPAWRRCCRPSPGGDSYYQTRKSTRLQHAGSRRTRRWGTVRGGRAHAGRCAKWPCCNAHQHPQTAHPRGGHGLAAMRSRRTESRAIRLYLYRVALELCP